MTDQDQDQRERQQQLQCNYYPKEAREQPEGAVHKWNSYYQQRNGSMEHINSVVVTDASATSGGRVVPSAHYYNSLPAGRAWNTRRSQKASAAIEIVTVKSPHCQLPETSI